MHLSSVVSSLLTTTAVTAAILQPGLTSGLDARSLVTRAAETEGAQKIIAHKAAHINARSDNTPTGDFTDLPWDPEFLDAINAMILRSKGVISFGPDGQATTIGLSARHAVTDAPAPHNAENRLLPRVPDHLVQSADPTTTSTHAITRATPNPSSPTKEIYVEKIVYVEGEPVTTWTETSSCSESTFTTSTTLIPDETVWGLAVVTSCKNHLPTTSCAPAVLCGLTTGGDLLQRAPTLHKRVEGIATYTADGVAVIHHTSSRPDPEEVSAWVFLAEHSTNDPTAAVTLDGHTTVWTLQSRPTPYRQVPANVISPRSLQVVATVTTAATASSRVTDRALSSAAAKEATDRTTSSVTLAEPLPATQSIEVLPVKHVTVIDFGPNSSGERTLLRPGLAQRDQPNNPLDKIHPSVVNLYGELLMPVIETRMNVSYADKPDFEKGFMDAFRRHDVSGKIDVGQGPLSVYQQGEVIGAIGYQQLAQWLNEMANSGRMKRSTSSKSETLPSLQRLAKRDSMLNDLKDAWEGFSEHDFKDDEEQDFESGAKEGLLPPTSRAYRKDASQSYLDGFSLGECFYNASTGSLSKRTASTPATAPTKRGGGWVDDLKDAWESYTQELDDEQDKVFKDSILRSVARQQQTCSSEVCSAADRLGRCLNELKDHSHSRLDSMRSYWDDLLEPTKTAAKARRDLTTTVPGETGYVVVHDPYTVATYDTTFTSSPTSTSLIVNNASLWQGELRQWDSNSHSRRKSFMGGLIPLGTFVGGFFAGAFLTSLLVGAYHLFKRWRGRHEQDKVRGETRSKIGRIFGRNKVVEEEYPDEAVAPQETVEVVRSAPGGAVSEQVVTQPQTTTTVQAV